MPKYLWKAKAPSGKNVIKRVEAATLQEARQSLLDSGYTDLAAQTDEFSAAASGLFDFDDCGEMEITPEEEVELLNRGSSTTGGVLWETIWGNKKWLLFWGTIVGLGIYFSKWWLILLGGIPMTIWPLLQIFLLLPSIYFSRLNKAKVWGRWDEVQSAVNALKKFWWNPWNVPISEIARNEALVLAAKGNLAQGLAKFAPYAKKLPEFLYISQCVTIYDEAREFDKALEYSQKVNELAPENATQLLDHAIRLVQRHDFPDQGEEIFNKIDAALLPAIAKPYLAFYHGLVASRRGIHTEAKQRFNEAVEGFGEMLHLDLAEGTYLTTKAHLCAAERALGNDAAADELWSEVEKFLRVHKEQELIEACSGQLVA